MSAPRWLNGFRSLPAVVQWLVAAVVLIAFAALVTLGIGAMRDDGSDSRRGDASTRPGTAGGDAMSGMDGGGMDMSGDGSVRLTAAQMQTFGITFGEVEERTLESSVRTVGIVTVDETRITQVVPRFSGYVERLFVDYTGQPVSHGQRLAAIYSPELVAAQEELLLASRLDGTMGESAVPGVPTGTSNLLAASRRRLALWEISDAQIDEILRSGRVQRTLTLHSPASGVVTDKSVVQGQAIRAGEALYTIADLSAVWIEAEMREGDLAGVRIGTAADISVAAYPERSFQGRVEFIDPMIDPQSRTAKARIAVRNGRRLLKPGMFASVRLNTPMRTALTVPSSALLRTGERTLVFVDLGNGRLTPEEIAIGRVAGENTEILSGLEPGQRVVTSAQFLLDSESNLAEVMKAMMGQMGTSDMGNMDMDEAPAMRIGDSTQVRDGAMEGMDMKGAEVKPPPNAERSRDMNPGPR